MRRKVKACSGVSRVCMSMAAWLLGNGVTCSRFGHPESMGKRLESSHQRAHLNAKPSLDLQRSLMPLHLRQV